MIAALFSAGILLIVLGTGAGRVLGVTTNIYSDFLSAHKGFFGRIPPVQTVENLCNGRPAACLDAGLHRS